MIVGLLREVLVAYVFGVRGAINQFTVASQIPNVVRSLVADAALGAAFIPVFNELLEKGDEKRAWRVASTVTTLAFLGLASITAITMLFAEPLLGIFYDGPVPHLTVQLTWILMPTVVLLGFAGIVQAILNSFGEFFVPAIAPVLWNLVIAAGLVFAMTIDDADQALLVYAWATLLGTVVQVLFPLPWLRGRAGRLRIAFDWRDTAVRRVFVLMLPVTLGLGLINVNALVDTVFASFLDAGGRAARDRERVPHLHAAAGHLRRRDRRGAVPGAVPVQRRRRHATASGARSARGSARSTTCCCRRRPSRPCSREPIVRVLFQRGAFDASQRDLVAQCLAAFSLGLAANGALLLLNRAFFSLQRPWLPTSAAAGNLVLNGVLDWLLYKPAGVWGIPLATSIANLVFLVVLVARAARARWARSRATGRCGPSAMHARLLRAARGDGLRASGGSIDDALGDAFVRAGVGVVVGIAAGSRRSTCG